MSEVHKFLFDGLPVRGILVKLTDCWQEVLKRRAANKDTGAYPREVRALLGEMTAAATLMQSNIKFNGALVLQIFGDGPLKLAVVEVQADLSLRATAKVLGPRVQAPSDAPQDPAAESAYRLSDWVNVHNQGKCAITLDPKDPFPGQQPYQGVVPFFDDQGHPIERFQEVLEHYMLQSEQLDTTLILASSDQVAAGLLIQRLPSLGIGNLGGGKVLQDEDQIGLNEDFKRISLLAKTLTAKELLELSPDEVLHRLFWEERCIKLEPSAQTPGLSPRFACSCSKERVSRMIQGLGEEEAQSIIAERGEIEVGCEFCGRQYHYDAVDAKALFASSWVLASTPESNPKH
jgi:molecular chaperone Hsp33